jgi:DNA-binding transcriptional LysR family regulator
MGAWSDAAWRLDVVGGRGLGYTLLMTRPRTLNVTAEGLPLVTVPLKPRTSRTNVVAAWPDRMTLSPRAEIFLEQLIATISEPVQPISG